MIGLVYPVAMYTPYIGLEDKAVTHGASLSDRSSSIERGLNDVRRNPLGNGLYSSLGMNDGICLLAELGMIGLFGFACKVLLLSGLRLGPGLNWKKVGACAPLLITALVSQPIAGAPVMLVICMVFVPRIADRRAGLIRRLIRQNVPDGLASMPAVLTAQRAPLESSPPEALIAG